MENVTINYGVESIDREAFMETAIKKIIIPSSIKYIRCVVFDTATQIQVMFEGESIEFLGLDDYQDPIFNSPTIIYYKNQSIIHKLENLVESGEHHYCTINHNVNDFYNAS